MIKAVRGIIKAVRGTVMGVCSGFIGSVNRTPIYNGFNYLIDLIIFTGNDNQGYYV